MSRIITVTNNHHFSEGVKLEIFVYENGDKKLNWFVSNKSRNYLWIFGKLRIEEEAEDKYEIIDVEDDLFKLAKKISLIFEFTCSPYEINNDGNLSTREILELIYSQPLEENIKFVREEWNEKGYYFDIIDKTRKNESSFLPDELNAEIAKHMKMNYGEALSIFGRKIVEEDFYYYKYPDHVWFILEYHKTLSKIAKNYKIINYETKEDNYFYFYYSR